MGDSPWGRRELDTTEQLHFHDLSQFNSSPSRQNQLSPASLFSLEILAGQWLRSTLRQSPSAALWAITLPLCLLCLSSLSSRQLPGHGIVITYLLLVFWVAHSPLSPGASRDLKPVQHLFAVTWTQVCLQSYFLHHLLRKIQCSMYMNGLGNRKPFFVTMKKTKNQKPSGG